jgi:hypothetical protein
MRAPTLPGRIAASWVAATGAGAAAGVALAILVLAGVFIAVAVPRASLGYRTQVVQRIFHAAPSPQTAVLGDANLSGLDQAHLGAGELALAGRRLPCEPATACRWPGGGAMVGPGHHRAGFGPSGAAGPSGRAPGPPGWRSLYRSGPEPQRHTGRGLPATRAPGHRSCGGIQVRPVTTATAASPGLQVGPAGRGGANARGQRGSIRPLRRRLLLLDR